MKKLIALLVVALSSVTLHAQGVWTQENIDPNTGLRTGVIEVNGDTYTIGPNANFFNANLRGADLSRADLSDADLTAVNRPDPILDPRIAELEAQLAAVAAERDAAIQERDARYTEEQIRALSPDYTMGLNEAGNVEVKISFIASSDAENFAPFPVTADSLTVVDGKICMELPPDQGAFFYRFRIE